MDDLSAQIDEIEALVAIYGKEWQTEDEENRSYSINIGKGENLVKLYIKLPKSYPSAVSPIYEMSAPHLSQNQKNIMKDLLDEVCLVNFGQNILFQLIERVREAIESDLTVPPESQAQVGLETKEISTACIESRQSEANSEAPLITHGDVILDRNSSFQGHAAIVSSPNQVKQVLHRLYENKKIKQATHNMYAYRIYREDVKSFIQDCDDDGESQAGGRLLHLLQIMDVKNVMVVVSRWYGGTHLGSARFRHINNAARQVLTATNFMPCSTKKRV